MDRAIPMAAKRIGWTIGWTREGRKDEESLGRTRTIYIRGIVPFVNERHIATPPGALLTKHENLDARFTSTFAPTGIHTRHGNIHAICDFTADLTLYFSARTI